MNLKERMINIIDKINETSALFYQGFKLEGYQELENVIVNLLSLTEELTHFEQERLELISIGELNACLMSCVEAMEQSDVVLISDILNYDLKEILEGMSVAIN